MCDSLCHTTLYKCTAHDNRRRFSRCFPPCAWRALRFRSRMARQSEPAANCRRGVLSRFEFRACQSCCAKPEAQDYAGTDRFSMRGARKLRAFTFFGISRSGWHSTLFLRIEFTLRESKFALRIELCRSEEHTSEL